MTGKTSFVEVLKIRVSSMYGHFSQQRLPVPSAPNDTPEQTRRKDQLNSNAFYGKFATGGVENPIVKFARALHEAESQGLPGFKHVPVAVATESAYQCIVHKARTSSDVEVLYQDATSIFILDREPQLETSTTDPVLGKTLHAHNR